MKHVIFNKRNEMLRVPLGQAMFYEAFGNYSYAMFPNKQKVMIPVNLSKVIELIKVSVEGDTSGFIRVGRRFVINTSYIVHVSLTKQKLILSDFVHEGNYALPLSKEALKEIKRLYVDGKIE